MLELVLVFWHVVAVCGMLWRFVAATKVIQIHTQCGRIAGLAEECGEELRQLRLCS